MNVDEIFKELGDFGPYQRAVCAMLFLPVFFFGANVMSYVFITGVPKYRCYIAGCDNTTSPSYDANWVQEAIPPTRPDGAYIPAQCTMYNRIQKNHSELECSMSDFTDDVIGCDAWVFDDEWTILREFNMTCYENLWKLTMIGGVQNAGEMVGAVAFGYSGDRYGRKNTFTWCILLAALVGCSKVLANSYTVFIVLTFVQGFVLIGINAQLLIMVIELVGKKKREAVCTINVCIISIGEAAVASVAWLSQDWMMIQLVFAAPCLLFVSYIWLLPESLRWLLTNGRTQKAIDNIKTAAKWNDVVFSSTILETFKDPANNIAMENFDQTTCNVTKPEVMSVVECVGQIWKNKTLCLRSLNLFYTWLAALLISQGLVVVSTLLGGDKYLNFALTCLVQIPGAALACCLLLHFGRRMSLFASMLLCAVTCVSSALVPADYHWIKISLFLVGKLSSFTSVTTLFVFTAELYPTVMRSTSFGMCVTVGHIGSILAPFSALLGAYSMALPLFLFGAVALIAALLSLLYPETRGKKLLETLEDLKSL